MSNVTPSMRHGTFGSAVLPNATPVAVSMEDAPLPSTLTLTSSDAGRKIEISTDGGLIYFQPSYDTVLANQISVTIGANITHCRFTGAAAGTDVWSIK